MNLKTVQDYSDGVELVISVDWNPQTNTVEKTNYVLVQKGFTSIDITDIFCDELNGDAMIDKINWKEISYPEPAEVE